MTISHLGSLAADQYGVLTPPLLSKLNIAVGRPSRHNPDRAAAGNTQGRGSLRGEGVQRWPGGQLVIGTGWAFPRCNSFPRLQYW